MAQPAFTVQSIQETQKAAPGGLLQTFITVTFKVGVYGPFTESFEKSTFDPNAVNARLNAFVMQLNLLHGTNPQVS